MLAVGFLSSCGGNNQELQNQVAELNRKVEALEKKVYGPEPVSQAGEATPATMTAAAGQSLLNQAQNAEHDHAHNNEGPFAGFGIEDKSHFFGDITEGEIVEHTFEIVNNGEVPLIIESAKPSCGCTVPDWPKEPIPVGGKGQIFVKFDSKGKKGAQNKSITVTANTEPAINTLYLRGNIKGAPTAPAGSAVAKQ